MALRTYRRTVARRRRATRARRAAPRRARRSVIRRRVNTSSKSVMAAKQSAIAKQLMIATGTMTDPRDFAQFIQPRLLSGKCYPGLLKSVFQCCNVARAAGAYPGCNEYLMILGRPLVQYNDANNRYGQQIFYATSAGGAFVYDATLYNDWQSNVSTASTSIRDINVKAVSLEFTYNGAYQAAKGRVWTGQIPQSQAVAAAISPSQLMSYPGVKEYGMDEILGGRLTCWGSKQSTHANDFVDVNVQNDDFNCPFIMITQAPLDPAYTTSSTTVNINNCVVELNVSFDYRPAVLTAGYPLLELEPDTGGVTPDVWNVTSKALANLPSASHLAKQIHPLHGASWPFNKPIYGSANEGYMTNNDLTTWVKGFVKNMTDDAADMIAGIVSDFGSDPEMASLLYNAVADPTGTGGYQLMSRLGVYSARNAYRAGRGNHPGPIRIAN